MGFGVFESATLFDFFWLKSLELENKKDARNNNWPGQTKKSPIYTNFSYIFAIKKTPGQLKYNKNTIRNQKCQKKLIKKVNKNFH